MSVSELEQGNHNIEEIGGLVMSCCGVPAKMRAVVTLPDAASCASLGEDAISCFASQRHEGEILAIVIMTCLFRRVLTCLAGARRVDGFVATSALAAVLVVFVGNGCQQTATPRS